MSKRIEIDGKFYRMRRGKLVEIPRQWVERVPSSQTMRDRLSQLPGKKARQVKFTDRTPGFKRTEARDQESLESQLRDA